MRRRVGRASSSASGVAQLVHYPCAWAAAHGSVTKRECGEGRGGTGLHEHARQNRSNKLTCCTYVQYTRAQAHTKDLLAAERRIDVVSSTDGERRER